MPNLNQVNLIGHLTRDPELTYTPSQVAVVTVGLAINRQWKTDKGEVKKEVCFVEITAWARLAEVCAKYLAKGDPAFFSGRLDLENWVDKSSGAKRSRLRVIADHMQLLAARESGPAQSAAQPEPDEIPF